MEYKLDLNYIFLLLQIIHVKIQCLVFYSGFKSALLTALGVGVKEIIPGSFHCLHDAKVTTYKHNEANGAQGCLLSMNFTF